MRKDVQRRGHTAPVLKVLANPYGHKKNVGEPPASKVYPRKQWARLGNHRYKSLNVSVSDLICLPRSFSTTCAGCKNAACYTLLICISTRKSSVVTVKERLIATARVIDNYFSGEDCSSTSNIALKPYSSRASYQTNSLVSSSTLTPLFCSASSISEWNIIFSNLVLALSPALHGYRYRHAL